MGIAKLNKNCLMMINRMKKMKQNLWLLLLFSFMCNYVKGQNKDLNSKKIVTKWAQEVSPSHVLNEYPRPQMVREDWKNLNGLWEYAISGGIEKPLKFDGQILVPFAIESQLSGVQKRIMANETLWYKRIFKIPSEWKKKQIRLNFGAVDWQAEVFVNGKSMGVHQGGYDSFSFDITNALKPGEEQLLEVLVWDPTSEGTQPRGKQVTEPNGIWYTPVSGIWQTVWIEPVPEVSIETIRMRPDIDTERIIIKAIGNRKIEDGYSILVNVFDKGTKVATGKGALEKEMDIKIENPKLWSPENPFLYDLEVIMLKNGKKVDEVTSYFGMRKISMGKDDDGHVRMMLNNGILFQYGTLDQGWWPDGLYTAPTDEALRYDIETTKKLGFNMIRKHVKVEPARWYYHCDRLGMLVWQDMPNGDKSADWRGPSGYDGRTMERNAQSEHQFYTEWKAIMDANYNKPSIVMWVPFNEGWGQFNTMEVVKWTMDYDTSRLVDGPSGGNFFPVGHAVDEHRYPGPGMPETELHAPNIFKDRVLVLGEFGGLGLPIEGHLWQQDKNWGYRNLDGEEELLTSYEKLIDALPPLIKRGLSAAIYTQTTDVEGEVNGLMTYDRAIIKMDENKMNEINQVLYHAIDEE